MVTSIRQFNCELYEEHLEEISFLCEQRSAYLHDPELTWLDVAGLDERLEAHQDALVVGADLALEVAKRKLVEGDAGEAGAALRLFCRQRVKDAVYGALQAADLSDAERLGALRNALLAEGPREWRTELAAIVARHAPLALIVAPALGLRRTKAESALVGALQDATAAADPVGRAWIAWALGRIGGADSIAALEALAFGEEEPGVASAAAVALLRLGHRPAVARLLLAAPTRPWLAVPLALAGGRRAVKVLQDSARLGAATDEGLIALGLLGDMTATKAIYDQLVVEDRAAAAALALQLLTGAQLYEEVFEPDEIDPAELFDDERTRYEATGELPTRDDGRPFGTTTIRPVTDQAVWKAWLSANKSGFDPERRYRYGELYSPRALLKSLAAERVPNRIRTLMCDEMRVRYGLDFPLEIHMPVAEQLRLLERLGEWVEVNGAKFVPGEWCFHGRIIETF